MNKVVNAQKLLKDIDSELSNWNERSQFCLKGVGNLSRADLDTLTLYAEAYIRSGGYGFPGLMKPLGEIREILEKYGITANQYAYF